MTRDEALEAILSSKGVPTDSTEKRAFEDWLERDAELCQMHEQQSALFEVLDDWTTPEPTAAFDEHMEALVEAERAKVSGWRRFIEPLFAPRWAAAAALATVLAIAALVSQNPVRDASDQATKTAVVIAPADSDYVDEWDRALEDLEMLTEFDALTPAIIEDKS